MKLLSYMVIGTIGAVVAFSVVGALRFGVTPGYAAEQDLIQDYNQRVNDLRSWANSADKRLNEIERLIAPLRIADKKRRLQEEPGALERSESEMDRLGWENLQRHLDTTRSDCR